MRASPPAAPGGTRHIRVVYVHRFRCALRVAHFGINCMSRVHSEYSLQQHSIADEHACALSAHKYAQREPHQLIMLATIIMCVVTVAADVLQRRQHAELGARA